MKIGKNAYKTKIAKKTCLNYKRKNNSSCLPFFSIFFSRTQSVRLHFVQCKLLRFILTEEEKKIIFVLFVKSNSFTIYKTPFDEIVVGGPIGPRFCGCVDSDTGVLPTTAAETDETDVFDEFVVKLVFIVATVLPLVLVPMLVEPAPAVIAFVVDFVMKNFSNLAMMCLP